jgi:mitotic spindle assembly checkpoint protein MAD1
VWADTRQVVLDRLRDENEALLKRLGELQDKGRDVDVPGEAGGDRMVPRESWELVSKERKELEETVKQKEKRLLRLQQVRSSRIQRLTSI